MATLGFHPVLDSQVMMREGRRASDGEDGFVSTIDDMFDLDLAVPRACAALALAAVIVLALFKVAGFRFSFGVGAGGG